MRVDASGAPVEERAEVIAAADEPLRRVGVQAFDRRAATLPTGGELRDPREARARMGAEDPPLARRLASDAVARDEVEQTRSGPTATASTMRSPTSSPKTRRIWS